MPSPRTDIDLRPYAAEDLELLQALLGDEQAMRMLGGAETEEAIKARHERYLASDPETNGLFTIVDRSDSRAVGWTGFWASEWQGEQAWECGWHVLSAAQGMGVGMAAGRLMLDEARRRHRFASVDAFPSVDNEASNALCRSLGFDCLGRVEIEYPKGHMMEALHWRFALGC